jgi:spore maturation protein CgeB
VDRLRSAGLPVSVFGKGWPEGSLVDDPVAIYRATQINLGLGMPTPSMSTMKNRDFECPGVGACYLTTFNWELAEFWDIGREILCYRNTEELMEIACWYRNRPDACLAIARAAWKRGQSEHTWEQRFRKVFAELGFAA